jgi:type I restriction enzyme S subunit
MKAGWEIKKVGTVCQIVNGGTPKTGVTEFWDGEHAWITPAEMGKLDSPYLDSSRRTLTDKGLSNSSATLLPSKSVILSSRAPIGHLVINSIPMATNQGCKGLIPCNSLSYKYLYYFLNSSVELLNELGTGATFKELSAGKLKEVPIPIPPLSEQAHIVGILDEAFASIATAKANTQKNLENAKAVFESHLNSVFSQRGEGWVEKKLEEVCEISSTLVDPKKAPYQDMLHVGGANIESKTGQLADLKTARDEALISGKFAFSSNCVLYSKIRPYLMKVARPDFEGLCSADVYPLLPLGSQITRDFLYHLLLSPHFTEFAIAGSARAGMPKVNRSHLFEYKTFIPPIETQLAISDNLDSISEETSRLTSLYTQKLAALEDLKKSLLHQAFTGKL